MYFDRGKGSGDGIAQNDATPNFSRPPGEKDKDGCVPRRITDAVGQRA
jgi:hypothetical protein